MVCLFTKLTFWVEKITKYLITFKKDGNSILIPFLNSKNQKKKNYNNK